jgi:hypothetical protein
MDVSSAFWEMVREAGSSAEEFNELDISQTIDGTTVSLFRVNLDQLKRGEKWISEEPIQPSGFNIQITYDTVEIDLYDPASLATLENYINKIRDLPPARHSMNFLEDLDADL